jgi:hypothetical protein
MESQNDENNIVQKTVTESFCMVGKFNWRAWKHVLMDSNLKTRTILARIKNMIIF